ncbi:unnamed protein product [Vitrella brassicaformis CCMP3155]|uniref:Uncharacterized protein n=1 Tax=Vitrella brassicaformis (strain CCMP3155) TaxID=1169540 RepID=A0A0G4EH76_VITBC|nr:unnamed protein product [Vitrella brassicaformis CCMP3155]|eukprot:CEL95369.1 unnamed protein product [Vitrella brassicaformis CCMP3155]
MASPGCSPTSPAMLHQSTGICDDSGSLPPCQAAHTLPVQRQPTWACDSDDASFPSPHAAISAHQTGECREASAKHDKIIKADESSEKAWLQQQVNDLQQELEALRRPRGIIVLETGVELDYPSEPHTPSPLAGSCPSYPHTPDSQRSIAVSEASQQTHDPGEQTWFGRLLGPLALCVARPRVRPTHLLASPIPVPPDSSPSLPVEEKSAETAAEGNSEGAIGKCPSPVGRSLSSGAVTSPAALASMVGPPVVRKRERGSRRSRSKSFVESERSSQSADEEPRAMAAA